MPDKYASMDSQLGYAECEVEDTEEMFWLRELDDYQSMVSLGNALAGQYRFQDAIEVYEKAGRIKGNDGMLYVCLGGANLSIFHYEEAMKNYQRALSCGIPEKSVAYSIGVWHYLKGQYQTAADWWKKCLPCGDEMKIAIIYWHTLAAYRGGLEPELLKEYQADMDVGHHIAYKKAVSVFAGECEWSQVSASHHALDDAVLFYGLSVYLEKLGEIAKVEQYIDETLKQEAVWPCISYLAAWNDRNIRK